MCGREDEDGMLCWDAGCFFIFLLFFFVVYVSFDGFVTFSSFVFFGLFPLLGYLFTIGSNLSETELFGISICMTGVMLFILGAIKSQFTTQSWCVHMWCCVCLGAYASLYDDTGK
mmetsp:Transcript_33855/g.57402  ORF Transcript_33855/g.57402 Transcript_33855/m.57402 type:complete len:115 (+) Transcript_33855:704-1048(+)